MKADAEEEIVDALANMMTHSQHSGQANPLESQELRAGLGAKEDRKNEALGKIRSGTAALDDVLVVFEEGESIPYVREAEEAATLNPTKEAPPLGELAGDSDGE